MSFFYTVKFCEETDDGEVLATPGSTIELDEDASEDDLLARALAEIDVFDTRGYSVSWNAGKVVAFISNPFDETVLELVLEDDTVYDGDYADMGSDDGWRDE